MSIPLPEPAHPTPVVLDASALAALRELDPDGSLGIMQRVLAAFERSLARMLLELDEQLELHDPNRLFTIAHTLKAPAASCGAVALSALCKQVEQRHREGMRNESSALELRADITRLAGQAEAALVAVRAMLRD